MTFDLFSSILCSGSSLVVAAETGAESRDLGWVDNRVISERKREGAKKRENTSLTLHNVKQSY